jgi:putative transposase
MQSNYISTNHSKHYLKAHNRKSLLVNQLKQDMYTIFNNIIDNSDFSVEVFESDINHIHFLIRYIPRLSISQIVRRLKQQSTRKIWLLYPTLLRREYWYKNIFWSSGYFVCSIGEASPDTIRQYILSQG